MYEQFFGLAEKPFNVTPDTRYLYPSPQHEGVISTLYYGICERKGFLLFTGEVGTGKTTSIRALLGKLGDTISTSLILNPFLTIVELLQSINSDFGCEAPGDSVKDQLDALNAFLLKNDRIGRSAVVIIDEAQNLSTQALEMARLLSNLETETHKLLQIILVGQPELEEKLAQKELRQLAQRIQIYCKLNPLDGPEVEKYIQYRINRAGNNPVIAFEKAAVRELYKLSGGIPRIINTLCELSLLDAYSKETRVITRNIIQTAAKETPLHVYHS